MNSITLHLEGSASDIVTLKFERDEDSVNVGVYVESVQGIHYEKTLNAIIDREQTAQILGFISDFIK